MNISDTSIVIDGNNYSGVNPAHGLLGTDGWGQPTQDNAPQTALPKKIYKQAYARFTNALPFGCPAGYTVQYDNVPQPASQYGNVDFSNDIKTKLSTGLPVCVKPGSGETADEVCYPQNISLMGEETSEILYADRGIVPCSSELGENPVKFIDNVPADGKCDSLDAAKKICDAHGSKCKGFYIAKNADAEGKGYLGCKFVSDGLTGERVRGTPLQVNLGQVRVVGGNKYDTYAKNTRASDYTPFPFNTVFGYNGKEGFVGSIESGMCLKNLLLLVLVAGLTMIIIKRVRG